jgi:transcription elongation factor GreA
MKKVLEERLVTEIRSIERELKIELPKEIAAAVALGDLSENAEYQSALERQRYLQNRLRALNAQLSTLSLISESSIPHNRIAIGSTVFLQNLETNEEKVYDIVLGELAEPEKGEISPSSPIGKALLNKEAGEEVEVVTPAGLITYKVVKILTIYDKVKEA